MKDGILTQTYIGQSGGDKYVKIRATSPNGSTANEFPYGWSVSQESHKIVAMQLLKDLRLRSINYLNFTLGDPISINKGFVFPLVLINRSL